MAKRRFRSTFEGGPPLLGGLQQRGIASCPLQHISLCVQLAFLLSRPPSDTTFLMSIDWGNKDTWRRQSLSYTLVMDRYFSFGAGLGGLRKSTGIPNRFVHELEARVALSLEGPADRFKASSCNAMFYLFLRCGSLVVCGMCATKRFSFVYTPGLRLPVRWIATSRPSIGNC